MAPRFDHDIRAQEVLIQRRDDRAQGHDPDRQRGNETIPYPPSGAYHA
jgi:hypothetical protein